MIKFKVENIDNKAICIFASKSNFKEHDTYNCAFEWTADCNDLVSFLDSALYALMDKFKE